MLVWAVKVFRRIFTINFHLGLLLGYLFYVFIFIQSSINESVDEEPTTFLNPRILRGINTKTVSNISGQVHILNQSTENLGNQDPLKDKIRVVCWVLTHPSEHRRRASHIKRTWGKRCNTLLFMSTKEDRLGAVVLDVVESVWNLRRKIQEAWRYVHKNHLNDGDWFIAVEDDSYVIMENLRQFLFPFDHLSPLSFGHLMQSEEDPYVARRPGYVLSHEAVVRLIEKGFNNEQAIADCGAISWGYDEVAMGRCLNYVGVKQLDTRDSLGRLRFLPLPVRTLISLTTPVRVDMSRYWSSYSNEPFSQGSNCCSDKAIVFHEMSPMKMYTLEYMVYHLKIYGLRKYVNLSLHENITVRESIFKET